MENPVSSLPKVNSLHFQKEKKDEDNFNTALTGKKDRQEESSIQKKESVSRSNLCWGEMLKKPQKCGFYRCGSTEQPHFGFADHKWERCMKHKLPGMVQLDPQCISKYCTNFPLYGVADIPPRYCEKHFTGGANISYQAHCHFPGCTEERSYGYDGGKRQFCAMHKLETMVDLQKDVLLMKKKKRIDLQKDELLARKGKKCKEKLLEECQGHAGSCSCFACLQDDTGNLEWDTRRDKGLRLPESRTETGIRSEEWKQSLKVGDLVDAIDTDKRWFDSIILEMKESQVKVHYKGWPSKWDSFVDINSGDIQPLYTMTPRWRDLKVGDELEVCRNQRTSSPLWDEGKVLQVDWHSKKALVQSMSRRMPKKWVDIDGEDICNLGTHIEQGKSSEPPSDADESEKADDLRQIEAQEKGYRDCYGKIMWAKQGKFVWWPCYVYNPLDTAGKVREMGMKSLQKKHLVYFFGTNNFATIPVKMLHPWKEFYNQHEPGEGNTKKLEQAFEDAKLQATAEFEKPPNERMEENRKKYKSMIQEEQLEKFDKKKHHHKNKKRNISCGGNYKRRRRNWGFSNFPSQGFFNSMKSGSYKILYDSSCHICHYRRYEVYSSCTMYRSHSYCANHVQTRLGIDVQDLQKGLVSFPTCPICEITCPCAGCARRKKTGVASNQGKNYRTLNTSDEMEKEYSEQSTQDDSDLFPSRNSVKDVLREKRQLEEANISPSQKLPKSRSLQFDDCSPCPLASSQRNTWETSYGSLGSSVLEMEIRRDLWTNNLKTSAQKSLEALENVWWRRTRYEKESVDFDVLWNKAKGSNEQFSRKYFLDLSEMANKLDGSSDASLRDVNRAFHSKYNTDVFSPEKSIPTFQRQEALECFNYMPDYEIKKKSYDQHRKALEEIHNKSCRRCYKPNGTKRTPMLMLIDRSDVVGSMTRHVFFKSTLYSPFCSFEIKFLGCNGLEPAIDNGGPQHEMFTEFFRQLPKFELVIGNATVKPMDMENNGKLLLPSSSERLLNEEVGLGKFYFSLGKIMLTAILLEENLPRSFSLLLDSVLGFENTNRTKEIGQLEEEVKRLGFTWILTQHEAACRDLSPRKVSEVTLNQHDTTLLKDITRRNLINKFLSQCIAEPRSVELACIKDGFENKRPERPSTRIEIASFLLHFSRKELHDLIFRSQGICKEDFFKHVQWNGFSFTRDSMAAYFDSMLVQDRQFAANFIEFATGYDCIPEADFRLVIEEIKVKNREYPLPSASTCEQKVWMPFYKSQAEFQMKMHQALESQKQMFTNV